MNYFNIYCTTQSSYLSAHKYVGLCQHAHIQSDVHIQRTALAPEACI